MANTGPVIRANTYNTYYPCIMPELLYVIEINFPNQILSEAESASIVEVNVVGITNNMWNTVIYYDKCIIITGVLP